MTATVPFSFDASSVISGKQMQVDCLLKNATATISQGSNTLNVAQHTQDQVSLPFTVPESSWFLRHSQDWTITLKATVMGITIEQSRPYHWTAPLGGP
jgi:hypothetical protein